MARTSNTKTLKHVQFFLSALEPTAALRKRIKLMVSNPAIYKQVLSHREQVNKLTLDYIERGRVSKSQLNADVALFSSLLYEKVINSTFLDGNIQQQILWINRNSTEITALLSNLEGDFLFELIKQLKRKLSENALLKQKLNSNAKHIKQMVKEDILPVINQPPVATARAVEESPFVIGMEMGFFITTCLLMAAWADQVLK